MTIGYNNPLYIQLFDHHGSFQTKLFGWKGKLTDQQTAEIAASKQVIYDGFKAAITAGVHEWWTTGRAVFWQPLVALRDKKTTREEAVAEIPRRYRTFVDDFESAKGAK